MNRSDWLALLFIIIIVLLIAVWVLSEEDSPQPANVSDENNVRQSFFARLEKRITQLNTEIQADLNSLKLSAEISKALDAKINRWLIAFNVLFFALTAIIFYWFIANDYTIMNAFLATLGVLTVICGVISMLCFFKLLDPNLIIDWLRERIKLWVYARHKHDPTLIASLEKSISIKSQVRDTLAEEKNNLNLN